MSTDWKEAPDQRPHGGLAYRDEKRRITVCRESPRYHEHGLPVPGELWIFYRDTNGFPEGEFATAELAMAAADKT